MTDLETIELAVRRAANSDALMYCSKETLRILADEIIKILMERERDKEPQP